MSTQLREVCFLIGAADTVLWSDASTSPVAMPDSRERWEAIWSRRAEVVEIVHTHPMGGLHFSAVDEVTMTGLNTALGRELNYAVVTPRGMLRRVASDEGGAHREFEVDREDQPWWTALIRVASGLALARERSHDPSFFEQE